MHLGSLKNWLRRPTLTSNRIGIGTACLIGAVAGTSASVLAAGVSALNHARLHLLHVSGLSPYIVLPLFGLAGGLLAGWLVQRFGPEATGSGIPQVKAALVGVKVALNFPTATVKFLGGMIVLGSGFLMGREGPTVHVCASLANEINRLLPMTPERRRQLVAAGAGAGLAAAFHAPIAGVMFVLEELLKDISSSTIGTAVLACFVGAVASTLLHQGPDGDDLSAFATNAHFLVPDIPWYVLIGVLSGLTGAFFNRSIIWMLTFFRDRVPLSLAVKIGLGGLLSGLILCLLPLEFANYIGIRETILLGQASLSTVSLAFVAFFVLTVLAYGCGAPGGLFAPSLSMGAALGFAVGALSFSVNHTGGGSYEAFALAGMGGMFSSVARVPVTAIIIIFEMTRSFELVLPLMIVCIVASMVADKLYPNSIYDRLMGWSGIEPQEKAVVKEAVGNKQAEDVMNGSAVSLEMTQTAQSALDQIRRTGFARFPVVHHGKLVGIATLEDFEKLALTQTDAATTVEQIMTRNPITVVADEPLSNVLSLFEHNKLSMLPVTQDDRLQGVITRSDLIHTIYNEVRTVAADHALAERTGEYEHRPDQSLKKV